jgi:diketogulonate reductase-like aldo/keto reductase
LLHQPQVTSVIVGAKRPEQLADNLAATQVSLSAAELQKINDASSLAAENPGWMLERRGEYRCNQVAAALAPRSGVPS